VGAKTVIVFGATGCGKSTFLNAVVNYVAEVDMEDSFRYKIIV
jgi:ABC-type nitrate/sulfonate/bicarbonate transport system ATPase subunit